MIPSAVPELACAGSSRAISPLAPKRDPQRAVGAGDEIGRRVHDVAVELYRILGDRVGSGIEPSDPSPRVLGEPDRAVGPDGDPVGTGAGCRRRVFADELAGGRVELADRARAVLGEIQVTVRSGDDPGRVRPGLQPVAGARVLRHASIGRDPPDCVRVALGEPHRSVRALRDPVRRSTAGDGRAVLRDRGSRGRDGCSEHGGEQQHRSPGSEPSPHALQLGASRASAREGGPLIFR